MNTRIRKATASDVDLLIALARRTISASYRPVLGDKAVEAFIGSGAADQYIRSNVAGCWVILRDGTPAGYAVCRENLIDAMMIDPAFHRRGLGTRLLEHVEGLLFRTHAELRLESFEGNLAANSFYRKNGWLEGGLSFDAGSGARKIVFRKTSVR